MSDYGKLYIVESSFFPSGGFFEVTLGYITKDEEIAGPLNTARVIVNVPGVRGDEEAARSLAVEKARMLLKKAARARLLED